MKSPHPSPRKNIYWRTASRSSSGGDPNCVEVGATGLADDGAIAVRDSKHHAGGLLTIPAHEWAGLIRDLKTP